MVKKTVALLLLLGAFLLLGTGNASAQAYFFSLPSETVHVYLEGDGTVSISYEFVFQNNSSAPTIEFVDVSLPTRDWDLSNITFAEVDGHPIGHVAYSEYVDNAVELGLGANSIPPGRTGTVRVGIDYLTGLFFIDDDDEAYASVEFTPMWFEPGSVTGSTDISLTFHLPPGVTPDEPRWHAAPSGWPETPDTALDAEGRVAYTWRNPNANGMAEYTFGASFPASYIPAGVAVKPTVFQRNNVNIDWEAVIPVLFFCGFGLFFLGIPVLGAISARNRRLKYLPPKMSIAGHGVKRGLTAIEAAILLEQPMDKILTMILFAAVKKNAATVKTRDPLELEITTPKPEGLRVYEEDFLAAFAETSKAGRRKALQKAMVSLVKSVTRKMKGFSVKETKVYYEDIINRAWAQVEAAETPEVKSEKYDEVMEWTMLDDDYGDRTRRVFTGGPVFVPTWWHRYDPSPIGGRTTSSRPISTAGRSGGGGGVSLPHLPGSDFAASVVNGVQNFSAGVIGSLSSFTSGVTQVTNPPPPPSTRSGGGWSGGGGGGSSCACACACAGCACACAGGGR